jgi:uncharacterized protein
MAPKTTAIVLSVEDLDRSKKFYGEGLGFALEQDHPHFVSFQLGAGSSSLGLYERGAAAAEAGVSPDGSGYRGVALHYIAASREDVDEVFAKATAAGGTVVKEAEAAQWGGYQGYFSDPDGHLWKVAAS